MAGRAEFSAATSPSLGIAVDKSGRVYVADRSNVRVQVFDDRGRFLEEWKSSELGRPYAVAVGLDAKAYVIDGGDQPPAPPDRSRVFQLSLDGKIEEAFGRFGNYDGQFVLGHGVSPNHALETSKIKEYASPQTPRN